MNVVLCAVVPSRNHYREIRHVVSELRKSGLPVFVIDDGSDEPARTVINGLHDPKDGVTVSRLDQNQGKGGAVCHGFHMAAAANFTHVLQVDADGQHDLAALPGILSLAKEHPDAVISGRPIFDASMPASRRFGRWICQVWVWIETLSFRLADTMCGFRVYPLAPVMRVIAEERLGRRMDFDIAILVRLFWRGVAVVPMPVRVSYPPGNVSNFDTLRDNWLITCMHTRLVLTMLTRLANILRNRPPRTEPASHWSALTERGVGWGLQISALAYRMFGRTGCLVILSPVVFFIFLTGVQQRLASRSYLTRVLALSGKPRRANWLDGYRHFMSFAGRTVDNFAAWSGNLSPDIVRVADGADLRTAERDPGGALFIVSHLGNADLSRALLDDATRARLTILTYTKHAVHYNELLRRYNPASAVNTLQVSDIGPETIINLRERIDRGEWIVIAGDRTPVDSDDRTIQALFLGKEAPFAQGPYILASLLECPVYLLFCLGAGGGYDLYVEKFTDRVILPRRDRETALRHYAQIFAIRLEHYVMKAPFQWYNFFEFWKQPL